MRTSAIQKGLRPTSRTLTFAFANLITALPGLGLAGEAEFGHHLCRKALSGVLPNLQIEDLRTIYVEAGGPMDELCGCAGASYAEWEEGARAALRREMRGGFATQAAFDATLGLSIALCLPETAGAGADYSLGEAMIGHIIQCESVLWGDIPVAGFALAPFKALMNRKNISIEQMCGCSGSYYLDHFNPFLTHDTPEAYDQLMRASLEQCQTWNAVWPEPQNVQATPISNATALARDISREDLCYAVVSGSFEVTSFDYQAQRDWEARSGLGAAEACACANAMYEGADTSETLAAALGDKAAECRHYIYK